jgi:hypothetical protein
MPSDRSLLERQMQRVELRPFTLDGFHRRRQRNQRNRRIGTAVLALAVAAAGIGGLVRAFSTGPVPAGDPRNPFLGTWVNSDPDGSTQTMSIRAAEDGVLDIVMHDDAATVCSGAPSTTTGTGRLESAGELVIPSPVLTCDDGNEPEDLGPPLEEVLRNMTFVHNPETDVLTDNFGLVWEREGREPTMSGGMWPQSSLEEVREAQELADAGDPRYTWQVWPNVFPKRPGQMDPRVVEFFTRFLQEELGWEEFSWGVAPGLYAGVLNDWPWEFVVVRCAPDRTNPLYPNDPEGRGCAPTIGEHRYETVRINADQPVRNWEDPNGPSGIWVVTRWAMLQPSDAPITGAFYRDESGDPFRSFALPPGGQHQVQQVVPPSDAEATAFLRAFLQARVDGEGAEEYLPPEDAQIPLLYATTSDAPYERFEFELVQGPVWPGGWREFKVRLFAEGGRSEVEQPLVVEHAEDGRLVLVYGTLEDGEAPTTENGEPLLEPYSILDDEVTFGVPPPWYQFFDYGPETVALDGHTIDGSFAVLPEPLPVETGCRLGPSPADAEALARSIRSDPDLEATEPVAVIVGGIEALRMDVVAATGASVCDYMGTPLVLRVAEPRGPLGPDLGQGHRMRLYLLDLPRGSSARILAIAFVAPEASFETMLEDEEARIMGSFEFHAP